MPLSLLVCVGIFPTDSLFTDHVVWLLYQLKYLHTKRNKETILLGPGRLQYLGYNRLRAGFNTWVQ